MMETPNKIGTANELVPDSSGQSISVKSIYLILILILAFFLRAWNIGYDLPYPERPDEAVWVMKGYNIYYSGDFNPHYFPYPSLFFYVNAAGIGLLDWTRCILDSSLCSSQIPPPKRLSMAVDWVPYTPLYLVLRYICVALSLLTLILVYKIAGQLAGKKAALLAALALSLSSLDIRDARHANTDPYVTFFIVLSLYFALNAYRLNGRAKFIGLAALSSGFATSSKYNGIAAMVIPMCTWGATFLKSWSAVVSSKSIRSLSIIAFCSFVAFCLGTPYFVLSFDEFSAGFIEQISLYYGGGWVAHDFDKLYYVKALLIENFIPALCWILVVLGWSGKHLKLGERLLLGAFPALYFLMLNSFGHKQDYLLLPIVPFLSVAAGMALCELIFDPAQVWKRRLGYFLILIMVISQLAGVAKIQQYALRPTVREMARIWINENLPAGSRILVESYGPYPSEERFMVVGAPGAIDSSLETLSQNYDYIITASDWYARFLFTPPSGNDFPQKSKYEELFRAFPSIKKFEKKGQSIEIRAVSSALDG